MSDSIANIDDNLQQIQVTLRTYLATKGADIASATTTHLATATGNYVHITGSTPIESFGTVSAGVRFLLVFDGALTLTNATSLILPGAANIVTVAGDRCEVVSLGSGNWRCLWYQRVSGGVLGYLSVTDFGADTTGVASAVTAFQAAIDSTADSKVQVIHVPRGTYLGDMTTLTYDSRFVVWDEEGGVT